MSILLIVAAHATRLEVFRVNGALALKARLPETIVQALAETSAGYLGVKLAAETCVAKTLKSGVGTTTVRVHVGRHAVVRVLRASCYGWIWVS